MTENREQWHLDKKVPIALIVALLAQAAIFGGWMATIQLRTETVEKRITGIEQNQEKYGQRMDMLVEKSAIMTERLSGVLDSLHRIEVTLDKKVDRK